MGDDDDEESDEDEEDRAFEARRGEKRIPAEAEFEAEEEEEEEEEEGSKEDAGKDQDQDDDQKVASDGSRPRTMTLKVSSSKDTGKDQCCMRVFFCSLMSARCDQNAVGEAPNDEL